MTCAGVVAVRRPVFSRAAKSLLAKSAVSMLSDTDRELVGTRSTPSSPALRGRVEA